MTTQTIKYPTILVDTYYGLNAFEIMGAVQKEMRVAGVSKEMLDQYYAESTAGDYDELWATANRWVKII
jgi:hypothetical protein